MVWKVFFRVLLLVGVFRILIVGAAENGGRKLKAANMMKINVIDRVEYGSVVRENQSRRALSKLDLNYTSKRRIPNGPDPIHNRRAGNSHQPPGKD